MTKSTAKRLPVAKRPGQTDAQAIADAALSPAINAAMVTDAFQGNVLGDDVEMVALVTALRASMDRSAAGDLTGLEAMLIGQATALQSMFVSLARRAQTQQYQRNLEAYVGLALKAQAQSRATIQAVIDLKFPRQSTFVKQANIAHGHQQVNNAPAQPHAVKNQSDQNKVFEEVTNARQKVDAGTAAAAATGHQALETLGEIHRPQV